MKGLTTFDVKLIYYVKLKVHNSSLGGIRLVQGKCEYGRSSLGDYMNIIIVVVVTIGTLPSCSVDTCIIIITAAMATMLQVRYKFSPHFSFMVSHFG